MTQHTTGPWVCTGFENLVVNDSDGNTITCAPGGGYGATLGELKAIARLIAAGPDLLEALRDLYALTEGLMLRDGSGPVRCTAGAMRAEQALAKAEGRG